MKKYNSVDEYFADAPEKAINYLNEIRAAIKCVLPNAIEVISYNMPAYKQETVLVYFAHGKNHLGFYPTPKPIEYFKNELANYKHSKGAVQFKYNEPLPIDLIKKMTLYRLNNSK